MVKHMLFAPSKLCATGHILELLLHVSFLSNHPMRA